MNTYMSASQTSLYVRTNCQIILEISKSFYMTLGLYYVPSACCQTQSCSSDGSFSMYLCSISSLMKRPRSVSSTTWYEALVYLTLYTFKITLLLATSIFSRLSKNWRRLAFSAIQNSVSSIMSTLFASQYLFAYHTISTTLRENGCPKFAMYLRCAASEASGIFPEHTMYF